MAFDKGKPIAGRKARYIDDDIRANNDALEDAIDFGHDFATGSTQTGEHNDGSAKIYSAAVAPTTKEDGSTALDADDVGKRLWYDTGNSLLKILTAIGSPNTWTSVAQLIGMLDEDDLASDSDTVAPTQQSVKAYVDGLDAENTKKDGSVAFTGDQSMGSNQLTDLPDPSADNDAARKKYVDDEINGHAVAVSAHSSTRQTTNSTSLVEYTGTNLVVSNLTSGDKFVLMVSLEAQIDDDQGMEIALYKDGGAIRTRKVMCNKGTNNTADEKGTCVTFTELITASSASHTFKIYYKTQNGSYVAQIADLDMVAFRVEKA